MTKEQKKQLRKEMLIQAENILRERGMTGGALKVKAAKWVEYALRKGES